MTSGFENKIKHFGDYTEAELKLLSNDEIIRIILDIQNEDNFILMTDSYKMTHHLVYVPKLQYLCSYMEARGGDMPYTVFNMLQYYLIKYMAGTRITPEKIEQARAKNIAHFGFDCFDDKMWYHIWHQHQGKLPIEIRAVAEGTPVPVKNILLDIINTDPVCAALTNITETLLMKLWAPNTVAAYGRLILELITRYHKLTSDKPEFLIPYMHHDFGYRGVSSEESAKILGAACLINFVGTDTFGALTLIDNFYNEFMAGFSVIATEHSVMCSYGGKSKEPEAYRNIIKTVKEKCYYANPISKVIIISIVSDTYNIYNVCKNILPSLKDEFIGWSNYYGCTIKIVVRPDSGVPEDILFGTVNSELSNELALDMNISVLEAAELVSKGVFGILCDEFGSTVNSKGYTVFNDYIGVLQGDGISLTSLISIYAKCAQCKYDTMNLVVGSGGKNLQAHDRDEQKYAIKATQVIVDGEEIDIEKSPITDKGKKSKKGRMKLVRTGDSWFDLKTLQHGDKGYDEAEDCLIPVFRNGEILKFYSFQEVRNNAKLTSTELNRL